jgi:hypothetical protein
MKTLSLIAVMFFFATISAFAHDETRNLELDASGISILEIDCGAGFLRVQGVEGLKEIEVTAEIISKGMSRREFEDFLEDYVSLSLKKRGKRAVLESNLNHSRSFFSFFGKNRSARIDLTVRVPYEMDLFVDDGSGEIEIDRIKGEVTIDDGSGSADITDIDGNLEFDDGSGSLIIEGVVGNVRIDDNSGDLRVRDIDGDLDIDDNSGGILVRQVTGSVYVRDGSGSIDISAVDQDVVIAEDGSGGVNIHNVKGKVKRRDRRH